METTAAQQATFGAAPFMREALAAIKAGNAEALLRQFARELDTLAGNLCEAEPDCYTFRTPLGDASVMACIPYAEEDPDGNPPSSPLSESGITLFVNGRWMDADYIISPECLADIVREAESEIASLNAELMADRRAA
ncbi:MAG: hypothetical protein ACRCV9_00600 [Burkholderiaceae bacterium]